VRMLGRGREREVGMMEERGGGRGDSASGVQ
jgi:hypothetical protein